LITTNSALSGARRAHVTGFVEPEHHGTAAISASTRRTSEDVDIGRDSHIPGIWGMQD